MGNDNVNHPKHYTEHPSGHECIEITEHMGFNLGNALKYIWRCDLKHDSIEDLKKAVWYLNREIRRRQIEAYKNRNRAHFKTEKELIDFVKERLSERRSANA